MAEHLFTPKDRELVLSDIINQNSEFMRKIKCDYHYVDNLVARYEEEGGYAIQLNEGSLASGDWILYDDTGKLKCFYIYEEALSSWASCQEVSDAPENPAVPEEIQEDGGILLCLRLKQRGQSL